MEIERLNQVAAATAAVSAAEMEAKDKKLAALEALLAANGLASTPVPAQAPTLVAALSQVRIPEIPCGRGGRGGRGGHSGRGGRGGIKRGVPSPDSNSIAKKNDQKTSPRRKFWDEDSDPMLVDLEPQSSRHFTQTTTVTDTTTPRSDPSADLPIPSKRWTEPKCSINNDGPNRQTLEIEIRSINGKPFHGSMCPKEAKHGIFKGCLDLDFTNFYGARPGWNGFPTVIFTLCNPINVDDLADLKHFDYVRKRKVGNSVVNETLGCQIRGIRTESDTGPS